MKEKVEYYLQLLVSAGWPPFCCPTTTDTQLNYAAWLCRRILQLLNETGQEDPVVIRIYWFMCGILWSKGVLRQSDLDAFILETGFKKGSDHNRDVASVLTTRDGRTY